MCEWARYWEYFEIEKPKSMTYWDDGNMDSPIVYQCIHSKKY